VRPALLATAEFCASCHKVGLPPEVTHDIWLRGQDDYDAWQQSAVAGQGAGAVRRPPATKVCQSCHMELEPAVLGDRAAKDGKIRSHRFLAANSALPALRGDEDGKARVEAFLKGAVSIELVTRREGSALVVDTVLRNRKVGHRFPGGTVDSNEAWVEVTVTRADGDPVARSGILSPRGELDPDVHLIRGQPVDGEGLPIRERDPQHMRGVVWDTTITPADPQVVRYRLERAPEGPHHIRARVRYRKVSAAYAQSACRKLADPDARARCLAVPVVEISEAEQDETAEPRSWEAWLDHGLGLADGLVERAGLALPSLLRAQELAPSRIEPILGLLRLAVAEGRTDDALALAAQAEKRDPSHPAPYWLSAKALVNAYRQEDAVAPLTRLVALVPGDREAWIMLGRARSVAGDHEGALIAADRALSIDAESEGGHYVRLLALRALSREKEAAGEEQLYLFHRRRIERDLALRARFEARFPERAQESFAAHEHPLHRVEPARGVSGLGRCLRN
jgi:cytochrome c-type biogenesis protein CcmH/NrfG